MASPSTDSPALFVRRPMSAVTEPAIALARGAESESYLATSAVSPGRDFIPSCEFGRFSAVPTVRSLVRWSSVASMTVNRLPPFSAMVCEVPPTRKTNSSLVWLEITRSTASWSRLTTHAMDIGRPVPQPLRPPSENPPSWRGTTMASTPPLLGDAVPAS